MATWYDHKIEKELNLKIQIKSIRRLKVKNYKQLICPDCLPKKIIPLNQYASIIIKLFACCFNKKKPLAAITLLIIHTKNCKYYSRPLESENNAISAIFFFEGGRQCESGK